MIKVNEYCGFCEDAFNTLLDAYQMKDWGVSWELFIQTAAVEFVTEANKWLKEKVGEEG